MEERIISLRKDCSPFLCIRHQFRLTWHKLRRNKGAKDLPCNSYSVMPHNLVENRIVWQISRCLSALFICQIEMEQQVKFLSVDTAISVKE